MTAVVVIGSGFAGLWAALGAARRLDELAIPPGTVDITMLAAQPFHDIRVRNYEADLSPCRIPLADLLDPVGVVHVTAEVTAIDTDAHTVTTSGGATYDYDRLVLASGSHVLKPAIPGLREFGFDVDTYDGALALRDHLRRLADGSPTAAAGTVVVAGAGLTGIEVACALPDRLRRLFAGSNVPLRVVLLDRSRIGSDMGASARPVIEEALSANGVETRAGVAVAAISERRVSLTSGEQLAAGTVVWCAGMRASSLTEQLPVVRDGLGRVPVDDYLRVIGVPAIFAAGDVAAARTDDDHLSVMSCQHGRPMGRYAGYNVISDLFGEPLLALRIPWYVTVLDLGPAGAVYTEGWDRVVVSDGARAKDTKRTINTRRIYPPLTGNRADLLAAAAPELQSRP
ncbi:NAD(P)/FAD-dependent oxidoreductase [Mycobacterium nebraskense]|uniref:NADH dehydrogenase n=1 Tax=Mycobacterium nebraskense TaxID=244292 RepID=A0A1X1YQL2_9MYCO|nr:FAD-dependent oxidoreductase [Mycobacterium nebraskense]KLO40686.1 NADH dehydrogenase [Mycobacterium nebraskense]MBI2697380.1 FAD-dependent oxidoreductase [Mycobacterium nebraskense]MCV7121098.1 FAD-dependent oxidoreductase [Mycobacterium nebraskense]ORW13301.1 NADH dehydrogenase [Mycobacterium nebraskense]